MSMKYHNSPAGPRICRAEVRDCKYAQAGAAHYDTQREAWAAYEKSMTDAFGLLPPPKGMERRKQSVYRDIDQFRDDVRFVKSEAVRARAAVLEAVRSPVRHARATVSNVRRNARSYAQEQMALAEEQGQSISTPRVFSFAGSEFTASPRVLVLNDESLRVMQQFIDRPLTATHRLDNLASAGSRAPVKTPLAPSTSPTPPLASQGSATRTSTAPTATRVDSGTLAPGSETDEEFRRIVASLSARRSIGYRRRAAVFLLKAFSRVGREIDARASSLLATKYWIAAGR